MWLIIIAATVTLLILIQWLYNEFFGYWKQRGVPHPRTLPLIGNLKPDITLRNMLTNRLDKLYNNYKDCLYVGFYQFQKPAIFIRDLELIETITIKEFSNFHTRQFIIDKQSDPLYSNHAYVLKGEEWKASRAQVSSGITKDKIKNMFNLMANANKNLIKVLNKEMKTGEAIDAKDLAERYVADAVALGFFGFEGNTLNNPNSEYRDLARKLIDNSFWMRLNVFTAMTLPYLSHFLKFSLISKDASKSFVEIFQKVIRYHESNNVVRNDFLDRMISLKSKFGENEFTNEDVMSRALTILLGSTKTNSVGLNLILYEIGKNFKVQMKLQEEIDVVMKKSKGEVTYEDIQSMNYLNMVIAESLRKYPPVMFLTRMCTKDTILPPAKGEGTGPNVPLEAGTHVIIPIHSIHMDPTYYPEPEQFIPERFSEKGKQSRPKSAYIPFGKGPRTCLAANFAIIQIKMAVISILANFNIKLNAKTALTFEIDAPTMLLHKKGGIWLNLDKRINVSN